jgi:hypothetical protein
MSEPNFAPPSANPAFRYLAIVRAASDFGLSSREIGDVISDFDHRSGQWDELAHRLADALLRRFGPLV